MQACAKRMDAEIWESEAEVLHRQAEMAKREVEGTEREIVIQRAEQEVRLGEGRALKMEIKKYRKYLLVKLGSGISTRDLPAGFSQTT